MVEICYLVKVGAGFLYGFPMQPFLLCQDNIEFNQRGLKKSLKPTKPQNATKNKKRLETVKKAKVRLQERFKKRFKNRKWHYKYKQRFKTGKPSKRNYVSNPK